MSLQERFQKIKDRLSGALWMIFFLGAVVVFTILKMPNLHLGSYIQSAIQVQLKAAGFDFQSQEPEFRLLPLEMTFANVSIGKLQQPGRIKLDSLTLQPNLLSLLTGKLSVHVVAKRLKGELEAHISRGMTATQVELEAKDLDLGDLQVFQAFGQVRADGVIQGITMLEWSDNNVLTLNGDFDFKVQKIMLEEQTLPLLFNRTLPQLTISEGMISGKVQSGKVQFERFKFGKEDLLLDDVAGSISGFMELGQTVQQTKVDLKVNFKLSEKILNMTSLIRSLLSPGQLSDGSYSYLLRGPIINPMPSPAGAGSS